MEQIKKETLINYYFVLNAIKVCINFENKFELSNGIKSPIYIDNRFVFSCPIARSYLLDCYQDFLNNKEIKKYNVIGIPTSGLLLSSCFAFRNNFRHYYVRKSIKGHGTNNFVEGIFDKYTFKQNNIILIDDHITTGNSIEKAVKTLRFEGFTKNIEVLSNTNYDFKKSKELFEKLDVKTTSLLDFDFICDSLLKNKKITKKEYKDIKEWKNQF
jgi:orotate phosphoribosyltransferase